MAVTKFSFIVTSPIVIFVLLTTFANAQEDFESRQRSRSRDRIESSQDRDIRIESNDNYSDEGAIVVEVTGPETENPTGPQPQDVKIEVQPATTTPNQKTPQDFDVEVKTSQSNTQSNHTSTNKPDNHTDPRTHTTTSQSTSQTLNIDSSTDTNPPKLTIQLDGQNITDTKPETTNRPFFNAKTHFPLDINSETQELTVTTPHGSKIVTLLPHQAIQNMLDSHILDDVTLESTNSAKPTSLPNSNGAVSLDETDTGDLAYFILGIKNKMFLGLFPINIKKTVIVSAETGQILDQFFENNLSKFLDALSLN